MPGMAGMAAAGASGAAVWEWAAWAAKRATPLISTAAEIEDLKALNTTRFLSLTPSTFRHPS